MIKMFASEMMAEDLGMIDRKRLLGLDERFAPGHGYLNGSQFFWGIWVREFSPDLCTEYIRVRTPCSDVKHRTVLVT